MNAPTMIAVPSPWPRAALIACVALIGFGIAWEWQLDPLRPGGSWLVLKVLPLAFALRGLARAELYTFKWMSLLIWVYVGEALVRIVGLSSVERGLAWVSLIISLILAFTILAGARAAIRKVKAGQAVPM